MVRFQIFKSLPDGQSQAIIGRDRASESGFLLRDVGADEAQKSVEGPRRHPKKTVRNPYTNDHGTIEHGYLVQSRKGHYPSCLFKLLEESHNKERNVFSVVRANMLVLAA